MSRKKETKKDKKVKILRKIGMAVLFLICVWIGVVAYGIDGYYYNLIFMPLLSIIMLGLLLGLTGLYRYRNTKGIKNKSRDMKVLTNYGIFALGLGLTFLVIALCGRNDLLVIPREMWALVPILELIFFSLAGLSFFITVFGIYHYEKGLKSRKMLMIDVAGLVLLVANIVLLFI